MNQSRTGLYIHIPFCLKRCRYCDFFSLETYDRELIEKYGRKVIETVAERQKEFEDFSTVYIGGGSPSLLNSQFFEEFSENILSHRKFKDLKEFTVELNPADIDENWLKTLADNGVNRISAGIQSMNDDVLKETGRRTTVIDIRKNLPLISKYFNNISVDFIYGLGKNRVLRKEVDEILKLADISHVSAYQYTKPEKAGAPELLSEEEILKQENEIRDFLEESGFERYEISNYSKNGKRSLHNMIYWSYGSWLGVGAAAHSFNSISGEHSFYQEDIDEFMQGGGISRFKPSENELMEEFLLMGLRTVDGIDLNKFRDIFNTEFLDAYSPSVIEQLEKEGMVLKNGNRIVCTEKGFNFLNGVLIKIFKSGIK